VLDYDEVAAAYDRILDRLGETYVDAVNVIHGMPGLARR
jgi:formate C-acetyltransferase